MTEELFQKFIDGLCGISEREEVERWLESCTEEELDAIVKKRWDNAGGSMPEKLSADILQFIKRQVTQKPVPVYDLWKRNRYKWVAAAACLILTAGIYSLFHSGKRTPAQQVEVAAVQPLPKKPLLTLIANNQQVSQKITLADGSMVVLYPAAAIKLPGDFNNRERPVYLSGKAVFTVAKNKLKPFTVYSNDIATRAVGTQFMVNCDRVTKHIDIRLIEGIIEVRSTNAHAAFAAKILHAGEELHFGYAKQNNPIAAQTPAKHLVEKITESKDEISFSNTPLEEVFERMETLFHVKIEYKKEELSSMTLTSSVSKKDEAASLLQLIGQMHGLAVIRTDSSFVVTAQPQKK